MQQLRDRLAVDRRRGAAAVAGATVLLLVVVVVVIVVVVAAAAASSAPATVASTAAPFNDSDVALTSAWARACVASIDRELCDSRIDCRLYHDYRLKNGSVGPLHETVWPGAVHLQALAAAAMANETQRDALVAYAAKLDKYVVMHAPRDGGAALLAYAPLPGSSEVYVDDNAWVALGLLDAWRATGDRRFVERAAQLHALFLYAERETHGQRSLRWKLEEDDDTGFTAGTAAAALAALRLHAAGERAHDYVADAARWYRWLVDPSVGVQDAETLLFHQGLKRDANGSVVVNRGFRAYQTTVPLQVALRFADALGRDARAPGGGGRGSDGGELTYIAVAQRLGEAIAHHWLRSADHSMDETAQWGGAHTVDAFYNLDAYEAVGGGGGGGGGGAAAPRWRAAARGLLGYVHAHVRDASGCYGEQWNTDYAARPGGVDRCDALWMASAAHALWTPAKYAAFVRRA